MSARVLKGHDTNQVLTKLQSGAGDLFCFTLTGIENNNSILESLCRLLISILG